MCKAWVSSHQRQKANEGRRLTAGRDELVLVSRDCDLANAPLCQEWLLQCVMIMDR